MPTAVATITEALVDTLVSGLEPGILIGDGEAPEQDPAGTFTRYLVVFAIPAVDVAGDLADPSRDPVASYQLTCVGLSQLEAQYVADQARARLESNPPTVSGVNLSCRFGFGDSMQRDDDFTPPVFYVTTDVLVVVGS